MKQAHAVETPTIGITAEVLRERPVQPPQPLTDELRQAINQCGESLLNRQDSVGFWRFDLEADSTIPAEYLLLQYFLGSVDRRREARIGNYIRRRQLPNGAWPLYEGGPGNISATVKAYFALKLAGESPNSTIMCRARDWVLTHGGAENVNVFTRICLAVFGQVPWRTVPAMPVEMMFLPRCFYFNLSKVSYWSRCVIVPLLLLFAKRPVHAFSAEQSIAELFLTPPRDLKHIDRFSRGNHVKNAFIALDRVLKLLEPMTPRWVRKEAVGRAERWMREHMQGEGGIGAIYPAMANAVMALKVLDYPQDDPDFVRGVKAIEDLVPDGESESYCQPCVSPIWDTCLTINALCEAGLACDHPRVDAGVQWLFDKQIFVCGDWSEATPELESGGWAFQFANGLYPDVDDTSMVLMSLLRANAQRDPDQRKRIGRAVNWMLGMQNSDGGWGAFDVDNHHEYLNNIPFADHGALVDPSTSDVTARCIEALAMLGYNRSFAPIARGLEFLHNEQESHGGWYGRWGVNYLYGTWSVLAGLGAVGEDPAQPYIRKAVTWLYDRQNADGGWGESCNTYDDSDLAGRGASTASQSAWALLALMAVGEGHSDAVRNGIDYLLHTRNATGSWNELAYSGTGFPRVFYLRYHGYNHYFLVWALGVYRRLRAGLPTAQSLARSESRVELGAVLALVSPA